MNRRLMRDLITRWYEREALLIRMRADEEAPRIMKEHKGRREPR